MHPALAQPLLTSRRGKRPRDAVTAMFAEVVLGETTPGMIFTKDQAHGKVALVPSGLYRMFARAKNGRQMTVAYAREAA